MLLRKVALPEDLLALGRDGINAIWRAEKVRAVGLKRAEAIIRAASVSIGTR